MILRLARILVVALPLGLGSAGPGRAEEAPADAAARLTQEAAALVDQKEFGRALELLARAQETAPTYAPAQEWLAHVYEVLGDKGQALNHVAALLALQPRSQFGADAARRLFLRPPFPRRLSPGALRVSPVAFTVDEGCALSEERVADFPDRIPLCYTTSAKYPDDGLGGGPLVERRLPTPGEGTAQFNRAVYGYREDPETGEFRLAVIAYYPSSVLSGSDTDLSATAQGLVHLALRYRTYAEGYLGLAGQGDAEDINRLWLCTGGPDGAERDGSDIYLYRVLSADRSPLEWLRQLAHESGHLLIPPIGGFAAPEMWANGEVGERLLLHWLADESGRWSRSDWPSSQAVARLDALWPGCGGVVEDYLAASGRAPLGVWAAGGPESELIMGMDERAMQYYVGLVLYVLAAHGSDGLREVVKSCAGTTVADFVYAYRQTVGAWAKAGPLTLGAGGYNPAETRLTQPPAPAALAPPWLALGPGDSVTYPVFLPGGTWRIALDIP
ncbi:MAG: tetratricopeptide repeat protein, partial [Armatimonadetes bacterium]|nr:tetratricopeptide repeat protein [Armatimonadota bacterium]